MAQYQPIPTGFWNTHRMSLTHRHLTLFLVIPLLMGSWKDEHEALNQVFYAQEFRLFYTLAGTDALPEKNRVDSDLNGTPDFIESIAQQLQVASALFTQVFGFTPPLESARYKNRVQSIDIHFLAKESKGSAGDGVIEFRYPILYNRPTTVLVMNLAVDLREKSLTPSHELFHLYQNGYSMFKNRWYTEGMARWSEYAFREGTGSRNVLPTTNKGLELLLSQTYAAKTFWRRLAYLLDTNNGVFEMATINQQAIQGQDLLIQDNRIYGFEFIRYLLEALDSTDEHAALAYGVAPHEWDESLQHSPSNDKYILCAIHHTISEHYRRYYSEQYDRQVHAEELTRFMRLIETYNDDGCPKL